MTTDSNIITNKKYLEQLDDFKQKYTQLPWYKRFLFNIFSYKAAQALESIKTEERIGVDFLLSCFAICRESWFFKTVFGLLDDFVQNVRNINYYADEVIQSPVGEPEKSADEPGTQSKPDHQKENKGVKLRISDAVVKELSSSLEIKLSAAKIIADIEADHISLSDEVRDFIRLNRTNPRLALIYNLIGTLPSTELANLFTLLESKICHGKIPEERIKSLLILLSRGTPRSLISAANLSLLCAKWEEIDARIMLNPRYSHDRICNRGHDSDILHAIEILGVKRWLTQERLDVLGTYKGLHPIFAVIRFADMHNVLNEETFEAIRKSQVLDKVEMFFHRFRFITHRVERWARSEYNIQACEFLSILTPNDPHHYLVSNAALGEMAKLISSRTWKLDWYAGCSQAAWQQIYSSCDQANYKDKFYVCVKSLAYVRPILKSYRQKTGEKFSYLRDNEHDAGYDLPSIIYEETLNYLATLPNASASILINSIKTDGIGVVWDAIKEAVKERMIKQFACLYQDKDNGPTRFIDLDIQVPQVDISRVQQQIAGSEEYRKYCKKMMNGSHFFLQKLISQESDSNPRSPLKGVFNT